MKLIADLHSHTVASGHGFNTILEMSQAAKEKGIKVFGITDHGPAVKGSAPPVYFKMGYRLPKIINGVRVLFGVEANIINNFGSLDLSNNTLEGCDIVMAGFHYGCGYQKDQGIQSNTKTMLKAIENPLVKVIAHPYEPAFEMDIETLAEAACQYNTLLEVNASYFYKKGKNTEQSREKISKMVEIIQKNNCPILIGSDAHIFNEVGKTEELEKYFDELGIKEENIINNDLEKLGKFLGIDLA